MDDFDFLDNDIKSGSFKDELDQAEAEFMLELKRPLTQEDCPKMTQIQIDTTNVMEGRVEISTFPTAYQQQIKNVYRFTPIDTEGANVSAMKAGRSFWK